MTRFSQAILFFTALIILSAPAASSQLTDIVANTVSRIIQPGYRDLAVHTKQLNQTMGRFCQAPGDVKIDKVRQEFRNTVLSWARVDAIRFGPIAKDNNYERIFFWPDPKGIGMRQVAKFLRKAAAAKSPPEGMTSNKLKSKSVALQGLGALEFLLYSKSIDWLDARRPMHHHHCQYASAITTNLAEITRTVADSWQENSPKAYAVLLTSPGKNNPLYLTEKEATVQVFKILNQGLQVTFELKLKRILRKSRKKVRARRAPFWRSNLTLPVITANLTAMRDFFVDSGFFDLMKRFEPGSEKSFMLDFNRTIKTSRKIQHPFTVAVKDEKQYQLLHYLMVSITYLQASLNLQITEAADLPLSFNALDGD